MKTIGLLGGMSWVSTQLYYREINRAIAAQLGGSHSAKLLVFSFDFADIETFQVREAWDIAAVVIGDGGRKLVSIGAEFLVLATNTMHVVAAEIERVAGAPLLHIGDATAGAITHAGVKRVGLLGTRYTMERPFLREKLEAAGIDVIVPEDADRALVHGVIYDELIKDVVTERSRDAFRGVIERLARRGAGGIVLGCTEIELLVTPETTPLPLFRTAELHARAAAAFASSH